MAKGKKTGGRVKGTPNKENAEYTDFMREIFEENYERARQMITMITEPKDFLTIWAKIGEFVIPKKAAVSVTTDKKSCDLKSELQKLEEDDGK